MDAEFENEMKNYRLWHGRKLTFREQCSAFACLYGGASNFVVERAFGLSRASVSKLSGCLAYDPDPYRLNGPMIDSEGNSTDVLDGSKHLVGAEFEREKQGHNVRKNPNRKPHYPIVAREFEALGAEEFCRRYYDDRTKARMSEAKAAIRAERSAK